MIKTSSLMARLPHTCLLIFYCFTFLCIYGGRQDFPSCEVGLMVRRGTTQTAAPQDRVTVRCPVRHCGESLVVTWCKLLDTDKCEQIKQTENVEIMQNDKQAKGELISFLIFKRISIHDKGLYRCDLKGANYEVVSHTVNISVSDLHQEADNNADFPSCEVGLMVRRGTTQTAAPQDRVTVRCPVRHCGESLVVTWCKLLDTDKCEQIKQTENVEIMQNDKQAKGELISFLIFKRISIHDKGLYRCDLKGANYEVVSHTVNISVSDLHQEADNNADFPSCEVGLMVQRGTTKTAAPQHRVIVRCPVRHCGESLIVTWCKLLDTDKCEQIKQTENVEIMQNDKQAKGELISFLIFKRISIHDKGLYRCDLKGANYEVVSHTVNISVSDLHQEADNNADELPSVAGCVLAALLLHLC